MLCFTCVLFPGCFGFGNGPCFSAGKLEQQIPDDNDVLCLKRLGEKVAALEMLKQELQARNRLLETLEVRRASSTSSTGQSGSQVAEFP